MSKKSFLVIPSKTAYDVDVASRINSYIQTCLSLTPEVQISVKEGLDELNRLRRNAFLHDECGKTTSSIDAMHRYYDCFSSLDEKIQITSTDCPIPFRWKIAFSEKGLFVGKRDLTLNHSGYEKACVLFNIAAYQSKYASTLELSSDENLRCAVKYFQSSANIFNLLKDDILHLIQDEIPRDLQPQLLNALSQLMITQANEVMYVKALKDGNSPAILRAIAMQLADNYQNVLKLLSFEQARGIVDKSWYNIIQAKEYAYQAYGSKHHFESLDSGNLDAIGERLARAREAYELFQKADQVYPHAYDGEVNSSKVAWEKAEKDNNLIYHARIPNKNELPPIPRKSVLGISAVKFPLSKDFKDIFIQLVSVHVNKATNLFQSQLKERLFALVNDLRTSDANVRSGLAAINMPALIEDELKQERIPASIVGKADDVNSKGGFHAIEIAEKSLVEASGQTNSMLAKIRSTLEDEERSDAALRENYGARWSTMASGKLTEKFKQEIGKYAGIIRTAMEADEKIKSKIRLCERDVVIMSGPRDGLIERIPPIISNSAHKSQAVDQLRELWNVMSKEMEKVEALEKRVNAIKYDPTTEFLDILKKEGNLDDARAASFAGTKLDSLVGSISKEVSENKSMRINCLEEMRVRHQQFTSGSHADEERTKALQQLAAAYDAFLECHSNLKEGTKFYNDLKTLLTRLGQQVDDFCFARLTEKEEIVGVLDPGKNAADVIKTLTDKSQPPKPVVPPRPPPPSTGGFVSMVANSVQNLVNRLPDMSQLNMGQNQPPNAPRVPSQPPSIPQHQQQAYQPNAAPNCNWYQQPQQYQNFQQGYYQPMPHLPYYGTAVQQPGGIQQPGGNTVPQPYMAPYPTQPPYGYPQPFQQPPQNQPPAPNSNNPFAQ